MSRSCGNIDQLIAYLIPDYWTCTTIHSEVMNNWILYYMNFPQKSTETSLLDQFSTAPINCIRKLIPFVVPSIELYTLKLIEGPSTFNLKIFDSFSAYFRPNLYNAVTRRLGFTWVCHWYWKAIFSDRFLWCLLTQLSSCGRGMWGGGWVPQVSHHYPHPQPLFDTWTREIAVSSLLYTGT